MVMVWMKKTDSEVSVRGLDMAGPWNGNLKRKLQVMADSQAKEKAPLPLVVDFMTQRHQSSLVLDKSIENELKHRKLRRMLSNRLSAQRAGQKQFSYLEYLNNSADQLQKCIREMWAQVEAIKERNKALHREGDALHNLVRGWLQC
ncbi:uncharacterized protein LOC127239203 [Andrographis paniculata]|uniref:uncharacterized protein LOC127239203 n=1 Tax=Andrographis paniculata TaxID=175694 RepID=UPI0021E84C55|nr:uncharacterized protein LOC127239203 [Andrographis paniculata]XP_051113195.1 uncharacterized protein LOC127239203 [Andrographis paniculata]